MLTVELRGRLGNQMFQYALCRIIALKNNYNFCIPSIPGAENVHILNHFKLDSGLYDGPIQYYYNEDISTQKYDANIFNVRNFTKLSGFFQTEKYFLEYKQLLKEWYKPSEELNITNILEKYPPNTYCYIHYRGGDYKDCKDWFLPIKYYNDAIEYVKSNIKGINFLIITDDVSAARNYFKGYEIISNNMLIDYKLLYNSKYCIVSNSSFSWWPCWLSHKELVVAPNYWFNYNNKNGFSPIDIKTSNFTYV